MKTEIEIMHDMHFGNYVCRIGKLAYGKLQSSVRCLERLGEGSPSLNFIYDLHQKGYKLIDHRYKRMTGLDPNPRVGSKHQLLFYDLIHPEDKYEVLHADLQAYSLFHSLPVAEYKNYELHCHFRICHASGTYIRVFRRVRVFDLDMTGRIWTLQVLYDTFESCASNMKACSWIFNQRTKKKRSIEGNIAQNKDEGFLTERQYEAMKMAASGYTAEEVASRMCISIKTVYGHHQTVLTLTGTRNLMQACSLLRLMGLCNVDLHNRRKTVK